MVVSKVQEVAEGLRPPEADAPIAIWFLLKIHLWQAGRPRFLEPPSLQRWEMGGGETNGPTQSEFPCGYFTPLAG